MKELHVQFDICILYIVADVIHSKLIYESPLDAEPTCRKRRQAPVALAQLQPAEGNVFEGTANQVQLGR